MIMALIRLTRPYYSLPLSCGLIVISSYVVGGDLSVIGFKLVYAFLSLFFILSAGYILNDVCDVVVDAINSPNRMLPKGQVTRKTALILSVVLFVIGIILASFCGWRFFIILSLVILGLIIYDLYSKKMGIFKDVLVAVLTTSLYPLSFALTDPALTPRLKVLFIHPVWLFLTTVGYEMLKDIRDTKGDSIIADTQLSIFRKKPIFLISARLIILIASLLTLLPYFLGYCKLVYLVSSIVAIGLAGLSWKQPPEKAIRFIYAEVFIITTGSLVDLLVYGP
jgi:geranylgeranylglycerol-phosphate geranylgeranyltransferase